MNEYKVTNLEKFSDALVQLNRALGEPISSELTIDGTIQRFEFCFELAWKAMKDTLYLADGIQAKSPKSALQEAYSLGWIQNEKLWIGMLEDRNNSSHTYNKKLALEIYERIVSYYTEMQKLYILLKEKIAHA